MQHNLLHATDWSCDKDPTRSTVVNAVRGVLIETVGLCVVDGQRRIVGLLDFPEGGGELAGWLEDDVPIGVWRGWLVTGTGEVVWLPGTPVH